MTSSAPPAMTGDGQRVVRTRLLERLSESAAEVVVISGPAGSGKSTVAHQLAASDGRASATLRLAAYLDDPISSAAAILDVLASLGIPVSRASTALTTAEPTFSASLLPGLTELSAACSTPYLLILDDIHLLRTTGAAQVLRALCAGVPAGSCVMLLSRDQTPDWLARTRASGRLLEVTPEDLAFDTAESGQLLRAMGHHLDPAQVAAITEHTEGLAVGVYLTGLALRSGPQSSAAVAVAIPRGSGRAIADYLHAEVLAPLDPDERHLLVRTSILDELTGPLCDALLERDDSARVLEELQRRLQLVIPIDDDGLRFRTHHLLREVLHRDLATQEPAVIGELHQRAALWFRDQGDLDRAVHHATVAGDMALVSDLVWPNVVTCVGSGRIGSLHGWLAGLSDAQLAGDRWLSLAAAWLALQEGDATRTDKWSRVAQRHASRDWTTSERPDAFAASLAVLFALVGSDGLDGIRAMCDIALRGLSPDDGFRAPALFLRGVALMLQRDVEAGAASIIEAELVAQSFDVPVIAADAKSWLGMYALQSGDRDRAVHLISKAAVSIRENHLDRIATAALCTSAQALVLAVRGDRAAASVALATARRLQGRLGEVAPWFAVIGRLVQARTAIALGDAHAARLLIAEAHTHMTPDLQVSTVGDSLLEAEEALTRVSLAGMGARPLTQAELRILQFLPSHLTFPQIGEHLFLSAATVKSHALSIYRKLGVSSRDAAVERARDLGLVEGPLGTIPPRS